jgi:hypothetical protein
VIYRVLADALVVFHLGFVIFVCLGGLLVLRWRRVAWVHLPVAIWGAFVEFTQTICPLTPLENRLRHLGGQAGYSGGFIEHHVTRVLYPDGLSQPIQIALGVFAVLLNVAVYTAVFHRWRESARNSAMSVS